MTEYDETIKRAKLMIDQANHPENYPKPLSMSE